jgi:hypothetical protein
MKVYVVTGEIHTNGYMFADVTICKTEATAFYHARQFAKKYCENYPREEFYVNYNSSYLSYDVYDGDGNLQTRFLVFEKDVLE